MISAANTVVVDTWYRSAVPRIVEPDSTWNRAIFNRPNSDKDALPWDMMASFVGANASSLHTPQGGLHSITNRRAGCYQPLWTEHLAAVLLLWLTRRVDRKAADAAIRQDAHSDYYVIGYTYWNSFREDGRPRDLGRMEEEFTKSKFAYANCIILGAEGEPGKAINGLPDDLWELREKSESSSQGTRSARLRWTRGFNDNSKTSWKRQRLMVVADFAV